MYVDSHAHLDDSAFDADREAVLDRTREAGVRFVLLIADLARPESVRRVIELAERQDGFYWAAGVDPHQAASACQEHLEGLAALAAHPKFLAVGEIGLDYYHDQAPRDQQTEIFLRQLELARELGRPILIHCRDAWADMRQILRAHWAASSGKGATGPGTLDLRKEVRDVSEESRAGILHCFTGSVEDAADLMSLGFYVSFAGNITFKKAENLRQAARAVQPERLLTETDSPYLTPVPYRGQRNEPARVREVTRELARLHSLPEEEMGRRLVANFARLFCLPGGSSCAAIA